MLRWHVKLFYSCSHVWILHAFCVRATHAKVSVVEAIFNKTPDSKSFFTIVSRSLYILAVIVHSFYPLLCVWRYGDCIDPKQQGMIL